MTNTQQYFDSYSYIKPKYREKVSKEQEKEEIMQATTGDKEAKTRILERNFAFIEKMAKRYASPLVPYDDLVQEGYLGLEEAMTKYDASHDNKFLTYASSYIYRYIINEANRHKHQATSSRADHQDIRKYDQAYQNFLLLYGRKPTEEELAAEMGVTIRKLRSVRNVKTAVNIVSLNEEAYFHNFHQKNDENNEKLNYIIDTNHNIEEEVTERQMQEDLHRLLENAPLSDKNKEILFLYYGMECSGVEIANKYGTTRMAVYDAGKRSLQKLRSLQDTKLLAEYLNISEDSLACRPEFSKGPVKTKSR